MTQSAADCGPERIAEPRPPPGRLARTAAAGPGISGAAGAAGKPESGRQPAPGRAAVGSRRLAPGPDPGPGDRARRRPRVAGASPSHGPAAAAVYKYRPRPPPATRDCWTPGPPGRHGDSARAAAARRRRLPPAAAGHRDRDWLTESRSTSESESVTPVNSDLNLMMPAAALGPA